MSQQIFLLKPRPELENLIQTQVVKGRKLLEMPISDDDVLREVCKLEKQWSDDNAIILRESSTTDELLIKYPKEFDIIAFKPKENRDNLHANIQDKVLYLESVLELLSGIVEMPLTNEQQKGTRKYMLVENLSFLFREEEWKDICFSLNIEYEDLPTLGRKHKVRELVEQLKREKRISELIAIIQDLRPKENLEQFELLWT